MSYSTYSLMQYSTLWISLISLGSALASLWTKIPAWIRGVLICISLATAVQSQLVEFIALLPLGFLSLLIWGLQRNITGNPRFLLVSLIFLLSAGIFLGFIPGFSQKCLFNNTLIPLCMNYGKPFIGFLLLLGEVAVIRSFKTQKRELLTTVPTVLLGTILLVGLFLYLGMGNLGPRLSFDFLLWAPAALFFSILPEEVLLRGFLQKELFSLLGGRLPAHAGCIFFSSLIFSLFHTGWIQDPFLFLFLLSSGIIYGCLFQITGMIETSILCRFLTASLLFLNGVR